MDLNNDNNESQSVDSLTRKEMDIYNKVQDLQSNVKESRTFANIFGGGSLAGTLILFPGHDFYEIFDKPAYASCSILFVIGCSYIAGRYKKGQGKYEQKIEQLSDTKEYKKAEKFMSQK
jgi:hypothetical protein